MITIKISGIKNAIAASQKAADAVEKRKRGAFSRIGSYIRGVMRRLIRKGKKSSAPGNPPKSHNGLLRDKIIFLLGNYGVSIGPALINRRARGDGAPVGQSIPEVLEFGGKIRVIETKYKGKWTRTKFNNGKAPRRVREVSVASRPYVSRALKVAQKQKSLARAFALVGPARVAN